MQYANKMKIRLTILAVASLVALFALESCDKSDIISDDIQQQTGGSRVIAVSFQNNSTKTELDVLQPKFKANDIIKVANGTDEPEECAVSIDGDGNATISTDLTGSLIAVYPASAAKVSGNAIVGVIVPSIQDGTFASANICKAEIDAGATSATFENQTAVFKLYVPEKVDEKGVDYDVKSVEVISSGNNIAEGSRTINVGDGTSTITDTDGFCYVSLLPGETANNIAVRAGEGQRNLTGSDEIGKNKIYSVGLPVLNGHEYVEFTLTVAETTKVYKWATCNIGASSSHDFGRYFAWGDVVGQTWIEGTGWSNGGFFDTPDVGGSVSSLPIGYDAARANWGAGWRIPDKDEYIGLLKCGYTRDGYNLKVSQDNHSIFFPAAGIGSGSQCNHKGTEVDYWSSSVSSEEHSVTLNVGFVSVSPLILTISSTWETGLSVRAVSE